MQAKIPIQNLYYLLCYSWNRLAESEIVNVSGIDSTQQVDLFGMVLLRGTRHLIRRGLDRGYQLHSETIPGVRGSLNVSTTARRALLGQGLAHCEFDELTINTPANQIIRSTIRHLLRVRELDKDIHKQLSILNKELEGIDVPRLSKRLFRTVQLHSNARFYRFVLSVCEVITDSLLINQKTGDLQFRDFLRDERAMARVFEEFLFNFYRTERPDLSIRKERISWSAEADDPSHLAYLPSMETDISLRNARTTLVIDAKYYQSTLTDYYGGQRVHSANLYQLFAYLKNLEQRGGNDAASEGMLLYPVVDQQLRLDYSIHGHRVRVCTVDLSRAWREIRAELLELVSPF